MAKLQRIDAPRRGTVTSEILDRQPPCNIEAEHCVLGSILILPDVCDEIAVRVQLRPEDFYDEANATLYQHILELQDSGKKIDVTLLIDALERSGEFERIGGPSHLARVTNSVPNAAHALYYAQIVRKKASFRALINASTEILRDAYEEATEAEDALAQAEQKIFAILDGRGSHEVSNIRDVLQEAMERIDARQKGEHTTGGVLTDYTELDNLTGGLHNSELIVLAARPSMGKTAFALNIAENVAIEQQVPVLFVSLEMSAVELADRLLSAAARVNGQRMRSGTLSKDDHKQLIETADKIYSAPLYIDDSPGRRVNEVAAAARRIKRREGRLGLIAIDYLQLLEPENANDPRQEQVARMTRRLKGLAREMEVPILCLAQLNRQAEASKDNIPRLSHLRESGAIEQDADVVMFVHREEYYHRGEERQQHAGDADIIVAKQRNGPIGEVKLLFHKEHTRFVNPAPERYSQFDDYNASPGGDGF